MTTKTQAEQQLAADRLDLTRELTEIGEQGTYPKFISVCISGMPERGIPPIDADLLSWLTDVGRRKGWLPEEIPA